MFSSRGWGDNPSGGRDLHRMAGQRGRKFGAPRLRVVNLALSGRLALVSLSLKAMWQSCHLPLPPPRVHFLGLLLPLLPGRHSLSGTCRRRSPGRHSSGASRALPYIILLLPLVVPPAGILQSRRHTLA